MSLDQDVKRLASHPLFAQLEPEALRLLAFSTENVALPAGQILFERGQLSDGAFLLVDGEIAFEAEDGGTAVYAAQAGSLIGATALLAATERPARARATRACALIKINRPQFQRVMREFPDAALRVRGRLGAGLAAFTRALDKVRADMFA